MTHVWGMNTMCALPSYNIYIWMQAGDSLLVGTSGLAQLHDLVHDLPTRLAKPLPTVLALSSPTFRLSLFLGIRLLSLFIPLSIYQSMGLTNF